MYYILYLNSILSSRETINVILFQYSVCCMIYYINAQNALHTRKSQVLDGVTKSLFIYLLFISNEYYIATIHTLAYNVPVVEP